MAKSKDKRGRAAEFQWASERGAMSVRDAGRKGGLICRDTHGHDHYVKIGRKGGQKVRDLVAAGKRALAREE